MMIARKGSTLRTDFFNGIGAKRTFPPGSSECRAMAQTRPTAPRRQCPLSCNSEIASSDQDATHCGLTVIGRKLSVRYLPQPSVDGRSAGPPLRSRDQPSGGSGVTPNHPQNLDCVRAAISCSDRLDR